MNDKINYEGKDYTKKELASLFNVKYGTFIAKLQRGWTLSEIKNGYRNNGGYGGIEYNGKIYPSKKKICEEYHLSYRKLNNILNNKDVNDKKIEINGVFYKNKKEATQQLNCSIRTLNKILDNKISSLKDKTITVNGKQFKNKKELANFYNINYSSMLNKLNFGWTIEQIVGIENPPKKIDLNSLDINKLSKQHNVDKNTIIKKIKMGYTLEKALLPLNNRNSKVKCAGKIFNSITEMAKYYNKPVKLIYNRLNTDWTPEEAVELKKRNTNE